MIFLFLKYEKVLELSNEYSSRLILILQDNKFTNISENQRTIGPENAHLKPDLGVLSHNEMTLTLNTHTPLLTS